MCSQSLVACSFSDGFLQLLSNSVFIRHSLRHAEQCQYKPSFGKRWTQHICLNLPKSAQANRIADTATACAQSDLTCSTSLCCSQDAVTVSHLCRPFDKSDLVPSVLVSKNHCMPVPHLWISRLWFCQPVPGWAGPADGVWGRSRLPGSWNGNFCPVLWISLHLRFHQTVSCTLIRPSLSWFVDSQLLATCALPYDWLTTSLSVCTISLRMVGMICPPGMYISSAEAEDDIWMIVLMIMMVKSKYSHHNHNVV